MFTSIRVNQWTTKVSRLAIQGEKTIFGLAILASCNYDVLALNSFSLAPKGHLTVLLLFEFPQTCFQETSHVVNYVLT